ncbi:hypothetical protein BH23ACT5_BH23ACT5_01160 [soil metagenome]
MHRPVPGATIALMRVETHLPLGKVDPGTRETERPVVVDRVPTDAGLVESLGFDGLVLTETKEDPFVVMAMAAATTERISLTTAVAIAFPRSPTVTAMTAWTLQRGSRGRFVLGLGTQVKGHIERRFGLPWSAPGPWIHEYVAAVRAVWDTWQNGTPLDFHGDHYQLTLMNPLFDPGPIEWPEIPIHLAAVNAHMARVGGRVQMESVRTPFALAATSTRSSDRQSTSEQANRGEHRRRWRWWRAL